MVETVTCLSGGTWDKTARNCTSRYFVRACVCVRVSACECAFGVCARAYACACMTCARLGARACVCL